MRSLVERIRSPRSRATTRNLLASRRGMTLFEVMIVIAIILMVMGALAVGVSINFNTAKESTTILTMGKIDSTIQTYTIRHKKAPTTSEGLKAVFKNASVPTDAWGNEYVYTAPGPNGMPYEIMSYGSDGKKGGGDDISWSEEK